MKLNRQIYSGICVCGCPARNHHAQMIAKQEYIDQKNGETALYGACLRYGHNETEGMKWSWWRKRFVKHCFGYKDKDDPEF
jgi:hypothetical protein